MNVRGLTLVSDDGTAIRFRRGLNIGSLAFVGYNGAAIRFGGGLDVRSLTLKAPLDGLKISLSGEPDKSDMACTYHHSHGLRGSSGLANEEKSEEESEDGRRREKHGCWVKNGRSRWLVASGGAKRQLK